MPAPPPAPSADAHPTTPAVVHIDQDFVRLALVEGTLRHVRPVRYIPALQGRLGLDLAQQHQPALIVLHLQLPDLSGLEVLRCLKAHPRTAPIPVLTLGPPASAGLEPHFQRLGAFAHLTEPLDIPRLLRLLGTVLL
jgi:CheY-like chemotaxis protein